MTRKKIILAILLAIIAISATGYYFGSYKPTKAKEAQINAIAARIEFLQKNTERLDNEIEERRIEIKKRIEHPENAAERYIKRATDSSYRKKDSIESKKFLIKTNIKRQQLKELDSLQAVLNSMK